MKVEIKFEANLDETQDLEMVRKICQAIGSNPVTVKTADVKKPAPAQDVKKPAPVPAQTTAPEKTGEPEPLPMDANSSLGSVPAVSIKDIRTLLASKVDNHREAIRVKLTELGAKNVTGMDARNYDSFYEFLKNLA